MDNALVYDYCFDEPGNVPPPICQFVSRLAHLAVRKFVILILKSANGQMIGYQIYEWDGSEFQNLVEPMPYPLPAEILNYSFEEVYAHDFDGNGTLELFWKWGLPVWTVYYDGLPFRESTSIYMWNGSHFALYRTIFSSPEYRFQAVHDGDLAFSNKEYDQALKFFREAIENPELDWWTLERRMYEQSMFPKIKPTPIPSLLPDPDEYPNLASYAHYRIMLIYTIQGQMDLALQEYEVLQSEYASGPGSAFKALAEVFWETYQQSGNMDAACEMVIEYSQENPQKLFKYIGNSDINEFYQFGEQGKYYSPEIMCIGP